MNSIFSIVAIYEVFPILQVLSVPFKNDVAAQSTEHSET